MPELPEVETTLRGIAPHVVGKRITEIDVRERRLRWPVPKEIINLNDSHVRSAWRRAKYLFLDVEAGTIILHLGMSGSLRIADPEIEWRKHDHLAFQLSTGKELRFHDPRRFGCVLFCQDSLEEHPLIRDLGPEPLSKEFDGSYLFNRAKGKTASIKQFIMNSKTVVGVGNIYACEALFLAGINPARQSGRISLRRLENLATAIKKVLTESIDAGGTTLRDFLHEDGEPGYFKQQLRVYGREGEPCRNCKSSIKRIRQNGRSTFYCQNCQT